MLAPREGTAACAFAARSGGPDSKPLAGATAAVMTRWPVLGEVETCFDGPLGWRICREVSALRGGGDGVATSRGSPPARLGVEAGVPYASAIGAGVAADEAATDGIPNAPGVECDVHEKRRQ